MHGLNTGSFTTFLSAVERVHESDFWKSLALKRLVRRVSKHATESRRSRVSRLILCVRYSCGRQHCRHLSAHYLDLRKSDTIECNLGKVTLWIGFFKTKGVGQKHQTTHQPQSAHKKRKKRVQFKSPVRRACDTLAPAVRLSESRNRHFENKFVFDY